MVTAKKKNAKKKAPAKKKKTKAKQLPLKIRTKTDAVGRAAKKYLKARGNLAGAKENLNDSAEALVKIMRTKKRKDIKIEGVIITVSHIEAQDMLKVKKPKQ